MSPLYFFYPKPATVSSFQTESSRLLTAAVINTSFRKILLADPATALASGYSGEAFCLNKKDRSRVTAIRAASLEEFAQQLTQIHEFTNASIA